MSTGLGKYAASQVGAHLREDPDRGGLVVQVHIQHSNSAGAPYERHVPDLEAALGYIGTFWRHSAPGRDAAEPPATGVEWGYRYRLLELRPGHSGRAREATADSREDAGEQVAALLSDDGKWEAEVIWRTAAVPAGDWHGVKPTAAGTPEDIAEAQEDGT